MAFIGLELRDLAAPDDDGEAVDKAEDDRLRDEAHQLAQTEEPGGGLDEAREDDRGEDVFRAVGEGELCEDHRNGAGRAADHAGPSAENAGHEADHEGGVKSGQGAQARNEGKGHRLGDEGHGDGQSAEDLKAVVDSLPEVEEGEAHGEVGPEKVRETTTPPWGG